MASPSSSLDLVSNITCLTSKTNHEEALRILKKVATMVRPIMKAHGWKINTLAEFYPKGLLGMNTNRGWKIQLCLRYHSDENTFLPWEEILGTMLHELAHNIRGPHDAQFYKALDDLNNEYDKVVVSGYTGEGFDAAGHRLGAKNGGFGLGGNRLGGALGSGSVTAGTRAAAVVAAEKRRQVNEMMMPAGGCRLGGAGGNSLSGSTPKGFWEQWHSPNELAVMAAERRAKDQVWCGSSPTDDQTNGPPDRSSPSNQGMQEPQGTRIPTPTSNTKRKMGTNQSQSSILSIEQKKPKVLHNGSITETSSTSSSVAIPAASTSVSDGNTKEHVI
ncbi:hypothetical protein BG011_008835 [Mortierella polycephala]|uniref:WLM domain-containing protein n=1 Tax=Mortierella polycephala TaxID=41804 RepID=A0A9P6QAD1_9FUNG|nr:hypothetical protein BG011_008835 [Mortierella polycephala]